VRAGVVLLTLSRPRTLPPPDGWKALHRGLHNRHSKIDAQGPRHRPPSRQKRSTYETRARVGVDGHVITDSIDLSELGSGDAVRPRGGTPCVVVTGMRGRDQAEVQARLQALEPADPPRARQDREDLRDMEAIPRTAPSAMARPRQSWRPDSPDRHRL